MEGEKKKNKKNHFSGHQHIFGFWEYWWWTFHLNPYSVSWILLALVTKGMCNFISALEQTSANVKCDPTQVIMVDGTLKVPKFRKVHDPAFFLCPWKENICVSPLHFFLKNFYFIKSRRLVNFKLIFLTLTFFDSNLDVQLNKITPQLPWTTQPYLTFHIYHNIYLHKILSQNMFFDTPRNSYETPF